MKKFRNPQQALQMGTSSPVHRFPSTRSDRSALTVYVTLRVPAMTMWTRQGLMTNGAWNGCAHHMRTCLPLSSRTTLGMQVVMNAQLAPVLIAAVLLRVVHSISIRSKLVRGWLIHLSPSTKTPRWIIYIDGRVTFFTFTISTTVLIFSITFLFIDIYRASRSFLRFLFLLTVILSVEKGKQVSFVNYGPLYNFFPFFFKPCFAYSFSSTSMTSLFTFSLRCLFLSTN